MRELISIEEKKSSGRKRIEHSPKFLALEEKAITKDGVIGSGRMNGIMKVLVRGRMDKWFLGG